MRQLNSGGGRIANLDKIKCTFLAARSEGQRSRPGRPSPVSHQLDGTRHLLTLSRRVSLRTIGAAQAGQWRKRGALQADQASCWVLSLPRKEPARRTPPGPPAPPAQAGTVTAPTVPTPHT